MFNLFFGKVSTAFHHLGITLGSVIDNVIEMIPEWPFQDSPTGDPFQNRNHLCRRKKNDVCFSMNGKNYGKGFDISQTYFWKYERYIFLGIRTCSHSWFYTLIHFRLWYIQQQRHG